MTPPQLVEKLCVASDSRIVLLVLDGLGGAPMGDDPQTEMELAQTPHLDELAAQSSCGLLEPVGPGITPGSGPAHLSLFGYDPIACNIGRGVLAALGIDFPLQQSDVAARINFATLDDEGKITDRRAGRISSEENERLVRKLAAGLGEGLPAEVHVRTVKEHRGLLVLRGENLGGELEDTDPQRTGLPPLDPVARDEPSRRTAQLVKQVVARARELLSDEPRANGILCRGFALYKPFPTLKDRFLLNPCALAGYPMYRGLARLVGMEVPPAPKDLADAFGMLRELRGQHDFFFVHEKKTDSTGEDGDFKAKVAVIEKVDALIPKLLESKPDVLVVTCDHSTPALLASHSWHPIPVLLHAKSCRRDRLGHFDERHCARGSLGLRPSVDLMPLALAHAGRLRKFGA